MRCKQVYEEDGWVRPVMKGYKVQCCNCGVIHSVDFKIIRWGRGHKVLLKAKLLSKKGRQRNNGDT